MGQLLHDVQHLTHHFRVQGRGGLVEEHHLGLHGQSADNGDALLLAAGELGGIGIGPVSQAHPGQQPQRLSVGLGLGHPLGAHRRQGDILADGHVGEEIEVLEHHAHLAADGVDVHLGVGNVGTFKGDGALCRRLQQVQAPQEGGFAGAGGADDDHLFTGVDVLVDVVQHQVVAEGFGESLNVDHFAAASFPACPGAQ